MTAQTNPDQINQQIVISGVGGQGVLFVTRLLADAAIAMGLKVFTSETHGMAQRGGTVISHLKVGDFAGPLIRRGRADGILALKPENLAGGHATYVKPGGWTVVNAPSPEGIVAVGPVQAVDAVGIAEQIGESRAANLVLLGFAAGRLGDALFCDAAALEAALTAAVAGRPEMKATSLSAFSAGMAAAR